MISSGSGCREAGRCAPWFRTPAFVAALQTPGHGEEGGPLKGRLHSHTMKNPVPPVRGNAGVSSLPTVCTPPTQGRGHHARAWVGTRSCIYRQLRARVGTRSCIYRQFQRSTDLYSSDGPGFTPLGYHQRRTVKRHPAAGSLHPPPETGKALVDKKFSFSLLTPILALIRLHPRIPPTFPQTDPSRTLTNTTCPHLSTRCRLSKHRPPASDRACSDPSSICIPGNCPSRKRFIILKI